MASLSELIDSLEVKFSKLHYKLEVLEKRNMELEGALSILKAKEVTKQQEIYNLEATIQNLKTANALLGSEENKKETKLKINSLIKEIDVCIAQLSE